MTDEEHKQIATDFYHGKVLFGLDRSVARQFFMDLSVPAIEEQTGEAPRVETFIVWVFLVTGHIALAGSWALAFLAFGWWSALAIPISIVIYFVFVAHSSLPGHGLGVVTVILIACFIAATVDAFPSASVGWYFVVLLIALWAARCVYLASFHFLRAFVLRNKKAYEILSTRIDIRKVSNEG